MLVYLGSMELRRLMMAQNKILDFRQKTVEEYDPECFLRFTAYDNETFFIKAKYKDTIVKITKSMLSVYSEKSDEESKRFNPPSDR